MKKINFILPVASRNPIGGFKVIYEYANRLINDGYAINIILPATLLWEEKSFKEKIKGIVRYLYFKIDKKKYLPYNWFPLDRNISIYWVLTLKEKNIPNADYCFATACETAEYIKDYSLMKGKKLYLIQGYENWSFSEERLLKTWKSDLKKIVIAEWLMRISNSIGEQSELIYNGLDFEKLNLDVKISERKNQKLLMLYHKLELKGTKVGLKALEILKECNKEFEITMFGIHKRPKDLPKYIKYYENPNHKLLRKLYNEAAIYIGTSYGEGWGLTVAEAMQCGCAIVCTDVNGYNELVENNKTGLLSTGGNYEELSKNIIQLLDDPELRITLANNGNKFIQDFTWEKAYKKLKKVIESC